MKNKLFFLGMLVIIMGVVFLFSGCGSIQTLTEVNYDNLGAFGEAAAIPIKDFEPRGFVYKTFTFQIDEKGKISGDVFKYQDLLKLAEAKGADAIINVTIDKQINQVTATGTLFTKAREETWHVSALAIKYTNVLTQGDNLTVNRTRMWSVSGNASALNEQGTGGRGLLGLGF
jgi:uncharacterized protein YceK